MNYLFVPYEESLELKELGFNEPCFATYDEDKNFELQDFFQTYETFPSHIISAPTFSQAFKWFREKHNLMFQIFYLRNGNYAVIIHKTTPEYMDIIDQIEPSIGCFGEVVDCYSYEEAEFECLKKLIQIVKTK